MGHGVWSRLASGSTRDNDQAVLEVSSPIPDIPPGDGAGQRDKQKGSPPVCREGKRLKYHGYLSDKQSNEETQSRLFLCHPTEAEAAWGDVPDQACGSGENVEDMISLPKGEDFVPLIKEAAQLCQVAVIVLSKEFLRSKWPMIELAEFHGAQQAGNKQLKMLPLFYELSVGDLDDERIEKCWMPSWIEHAKKDERIDLEKWSAAVRAVRGSNGLIYHKNAMSKVGYRKDVVQCISRLSASDLLFGSSQDMVGYDRICKRVSDHFSKEFLGRVCYVELDGTLRMGRVKHVKLGETSRLKRVKLILERLCGFDMVMGRCCIELRTLVRD